MENQAQTKARGEEVPSFDPRDYKIIKETTSDNKAIYRHPTGSTIRTVSYGLENLMRDNLNKIQNLVDMLADGDYADFGFIVEALMRDIWRGQDEAFDWINKHIGDIMFELVSRGDDIYRGGRLLSVSLHKPDQSKEV